MNRLMKRILIAVTAAMLAVTGVSTVYANDGMGISTMNVTIQDCEQDMVVTSEKANVREAPGTDARILHTLTKGRRIHVDGRVSNGWYRIWTTDPVYGGQTAGYIAGNLLGAVSADSTGISVRTSAADTSAAAPIPGVAHVQPRPVAVIAPPVPAAQPAPEAVIPGVAHVHPAVNA